MDEADLPLAEKYYLQSLEIRQELNLNHYLIEDWAGLAKLKLAQGDYEGARKYGQKGREYLRENPHLDGAENAMRAFRFIWETLTELGESSMADEVLTLAAQVIREYLDKNYDPVMREMYLDQPHHAVLWTAWKEKREV